MQSSTAAPTPESEAIGPVLFVLYGTESGNSKNLAGDVGSAAAKVGITARVLGLDQLSAEEITKMTHAVVVIATSGEGDMPYNAVDFWDALSAEGFPNLHHLNFGVLALGESVYEQFCSAGIKIDERLEELGAKRLVDRTDCDWDFETPAATWTEQAVAAFAASISDYQGPNVANDVVASAESEGRPLYPARITVKKILTKGETEREVVHYSLDIDPTGSGEVPFEWQPGDSINVFYGNDPALVDQILERLELAPGAVVAGPDSPLRDLLLNDLDIRLLSRDLVQEAAKQGCGEDLRQMLSTNTAGAFEEWRDSHDLLQLLIEHPNVRFTADKLAELLRPLGSRAYSIASSPLVSKNRIDLSVRTVWYEAGGRTHEGVVSGGMSSRAREGDMVQIQHRPNTSFRLPEDENAHVIMIGAGVGTAPFRGFLQHRAELGEPGKNWLFHGIRHPDEDELYTNELATWQSAGLLSTYDLCASRIKEGKQYVQHRILDRGQELFQALNDGAILYVCGDAQHMAKDVRAAIDQVAADALGSKEEGEEYVQRVIRDHRYLQDVY